MGKLQYLFCAILLSCVSIYGQEADPEKEKALRASKNLTWEGNQELSSNNFIQAEAEYRKAISKSDKNSVAPYNLGTAYYKNDSYSEAFGRFKQAGEVASQKENKHKAFHNMGNVFMKRKEYEKAIEAYKEALRNNPSDEETRYNLALAKELAKKEKDQQKGGDKEEEKDKKEDDQDKEKKDDNKEDQEKKDENKKEGDEGDQEKEENKKGEGDDKKEEPKQGQKPEEQKQPRPNQLSPQQIKNLLEAMQNEERKVQEKMDAKKVKGVKTKNVKDW
ncbi:MAG: tetratricopeptide repeat protein [Eudoraea sp.]|nr:tetratricopeptide repeat protein [Eudoraea sp.]